MNLIILVQNVIFKQNLISPRKITFSLHKNSQKTSSFSSQNITSLFSQQQDIKESVIKTVWFHWTSKHDNINRKTPSGASASCIEIGHSVKMPVKLSNRSS